ncbi:osteocalcin 2-like [Eutrema salsugineum]|uniref:osteocalcin 2-like n=1 Tax=Eutrema salsugineum TaxID=72664 RepID=UPI000CECF951|nr:osteocalcin 2-like [Eutrema salsugineum]
MSPSLSHPTSSSSLSDRTSSSSSSDSSPSQNDPKGKRVASPAPDPSGSSSSSSSSSTSEEVGPSQLNNEIGSGQVTDDLEEAHNVEVGRSGETQSNGEVQLDGVGLDGAHHEVVLGIPAIRRKIVTPASVEASCSDSKTITLALRQAGPHSGIKVKKPKSATMGCS